ncbi:nucleotidyl transferase AbiEii/AbiGii toxin family protein [Ramlibacter albus]|uniref:DUF6036 domain-containing protein n=1 Tax=Ramlibacter albus TaxID=2079448 RepID=A0A923S2M6_9BURK|nr:nucleotidyl transferase AbiEii/AbiGii toxin family protein [Ramlibacter albus]MBC5765634.1 hypothetical protein [Ramlibacter albus]
MSRQPAPRQPTEGDIALLAKALGDCGVEYVVIGGAAMALHGFPRMTRDIDLFVPVDPNNNARLLKALRALPGSRAAVSQLDPKYMDRGHSTALEGEIAIDILYVAAHRTFEDLRDHVQRVDLDGIPVWTLDIDGMLMTKKTARESDVPDRLKLERLRTALHDAERQRREHSLAGLRADGSAAVRFFAAMAQAAASAAAKAAVDWKHLEEEVLKAGSKDRAIDVRDLAEALCRHSPGAVYPTRQAWLRERAQALVRAAATKRKQ